MLSATDGVEGLTLAREVRPTVIILDIHLPRLDGWTVLSRIKSDPDLATLPVVLISVEEQRARGFALGASEFLVKPFEPDRLLNVVRRAMAPTGGDVLVVDDDEATREIVQRHLRRAGYSTIEARDGEEALLRTRVLAPGLIILDLLMPNVDGFEVLRTMRAEGMALPVMVLTGKTIGPDEDRFMRDGLARVVQKGGMALDSIVREAKQLVLAKRVVESGRLPRILYIEDSPQNRDIVRRYLADDYEVLEAEDGEHGVEVAVRELPDLILMDLSLPRLDGWEATRRIKANSTVKHIPVLALTAHAAREDQQRATEAGCSDYLTKPVERELLLGTIKKHLASGQGDQRPMPPCACWSSTTTRSSSSYRAARSSHDGFEVRGAPSLAEVTETRAKLRTAARARRRQHARGTERARCRGRARGRACRAARAVLGVEASKLRDDRPDGQRRRLPVEE